jgi:general stress protein CsbA
VKYLESRKIIKLDIVIITAGFFATESLEGMETSYAL